MPSSINEVVLRLKVGGGAAASAEFRRVAVSGQTLERQIDATGKSTERAGKRSEGMRNVLGQIRGMAKLAGPALVQMGMQGISAGLKYNTVLESANTAFTNFLGSTQRAEKFTARLAGVSSKSPLPLESYMNSAKHMLNFGVAARDVVPYLQSVNKAAVATGQGGPGMERIANALGQIKAKGKISAEGLQQLKAAGVPANKILQKEFGLTNKQMGNIGSQGIKADKAIKAITRGWETQFGPAYKNASKSFDGQWSVAKKQFQKFLGEGLEPVITFLEKKALPAGRRFLAWLNRLPNATKSLILGGAIVAGLAIFGGGLGLIVAAIAAVGIVAIKYHRQIGDFVSSIVGWVTGAAKAVGKWVSTAAKNVKGFIGDLLPVRLLIAGLRLQFAILKPVVLGVFAVIRERVKFVAAIFKIAFSAIKIYVRTAWEVIKRLGAIVGNVVAIVSNLLRGNWRGAWNAAKRLVSNAFGIIKAVARGALAYITTIPRQILGLFKGMPGRLGAVTSGLFDGIKTAFSGVVNWLIGVWNGLEFSIGGMSISILGKEINIPKVSLSTPNISPIGSGGGSGDSGGGGGPGPGKASFGGDTTLASKAGASNFNFAGGADTTTVTKAAVSSPTVFKLYLDGRELAYSMSERVDDEAALA